MDEIEKIEGKKMRKRLFEIIEVGKEDDIVSRIYDFSMMTTIFISIIPLVTKSTNSIFMLIDKVTVTIFIIDYLLRLLTADYKLKKGKISFVLYPFSFMAIIDLFSILPSIIVINQTLKLLKVFRLLRTFKVFRVFKSFRYSKNIQMILNVFKSQKDSLITVGVLAVGYIIITALIIFNIEPETFDSFFQALYWATISLTTMGYGDIYAISIAGQVITMVSSLFGIAIVALPAGIITAGYMEEIKQNSKCEDEDGEINEKNK